MAFATDTHAEICASGLLASHPPPLQFHPQRHLAFQLHWDARVPLLALATLPGVAMAFVMMADLAQNTLDASLAPTAKIVGHAAKTHHQMLLRSHHLAPVAMSALELRLLPAMATATMVGKVRSTMVAR